MLNYPEADYRQFLEDVYCQTDDYIGHFLTADRQRLDHLYRFRPFAGIL